MQEIDEKIKKEAEHWASNVNQYKDKSKADLIQLVYIEAANRYRSDELEERFNDYVNHYTKQQQELNHMSNKFREADEQKEKYEELLDDIIAAHTKTIEILKDKLGE